MIQKRQQKTAKQGDQFCKEMSALFQESIHIRWHRLWLQIWQHLQGWGFCWPMFCHQILHYQCLVNSHDMCLRDSQPHVQQWQRRKQKLQIARSVVLFPSSPLQFPTSQGSDLQRRTMAVTHWCISSGNHLSVEKNVHSSLSLSCCNCLFCWWHDFQQFFLPSLVYCVYWIFFLQIILDINRADMANKN